MHAYEDGKKMANITGERKFEKCSNSTKCSSCDFKSVVSTTCITLAAPGKSTALLLQPSCLWPGLEIVLRKHIKYVAEMLFNAINGMFVLKILHGNVATSLLPLLERMCVGVGEARSQ